jgi:hypothetical protein
VGKWQTEYCLFFPILSPRVLANPGTLKFCNVVGRCIENDFKGITGQTNQ